jgi:hypothetical protein
MMAEQRAQSAASHAHRPGWTAAAAVLSIVALTLFLIEIVRRPGVVTLGLLFLTFSVWCLVAISRVYIVRLQDRIIRLEMRVRLARLGRDADFDRLSKRQLVALRFASDAELPALIQRTLAENLDSRQIKEAVRDWQPDHHRT